MQLCIKCKERHEWQVQIPHSQVHTRNSPERHQMTTKLPTALTIHWRWRDLRPRKFHPFPSIGAGLPRMEMLF